MRHLVIDLETSIKNVGPGAIGDHKASPYLPKNKIVLFGGLYNDNVHIKKQSELSINFSGKLLVGFNIKFDLLYLIRDYGVHILKNTRIWDCQLAEYILSGQSILYPSLDGVAPKYGGTLKDSRIKDYWDSGVDTEDIPESELREYLKHDLENTYKVFIGQKQKVESLGISGLVENDMNALLLTTLMEHNGARFDFQGAIKYKGGLQVELERLEDSLVNFIPSDMVIHWNPGSVKIVSLILFGGVFEYQAKEPKLDEEGNQVYFKSGIKKGEPRYQLVEKTIEISPLSDITLPDTSEKSLSVILDKSQSPFCVEFVKTLLKYREIKKDISTYFEGYCNMVWPDGCIHPKLNHCSTATSRLSCTSPNIQNITNKE